MNCHYLKMSNSEEGISLLLVVLISAFILTIGLGLSTLFIREIKIMKAVGHSVVAISAADSGIEAALYDLYHSSSPTSSHSDMSDSVHLGSAHYRTEAVCCDPNMDSCSLEPSADNPSGCPLGERHIRSECKGANYCLTSVGIFKGTARAIETDY